MGDRIGSIRFMEIRDPCVSYYYDVCIYKGLYSETSFVLIKLPGLQREFKHLEINVPARICYLVEICF